MRFSRTNMRLAAARCRVLSRKIGVQTAEFSITAFCWRNADSRKSRTYERHNAEIRLELFNLSCAWQLQPSWPGWPLTCVGRHGAGRHGAKRTKGVRRSQRPPDEPDSASADGARDPLSSGPCSAQAPDQNPLHHGLVALATKTPS